MKTLGILGGMGPYAGLYFCNQLLQLSIEQHGVKRNADFPHFLLSNLPVPDLIADRRDEERTVTMVQEEAKRLEIAGAELMVLVCNTMHLFEDRFRGAITVPFLSLVQAVIQKVEYHKRKRVGLLGSLITMHSDLYATPLQRTGIELLLPTPMEQQNLTRCVQQIVAHQAGDYERSLLNELIQSLQLQGAEAVILACTELPQIFDPKSVTLPVYDSVRILAEVACEAMYASAPWRTSP